MLKKNLTVMMKKQPIIWYLFKGISAATGRKRITAEGHKSERFVRREANLYIHLNLCLKVL